MTSRCGFAPVNLAYVASLSRKNTSEHYLYAIWHPQHHIIYGRQLILEETTGDIRKLHWSFSQMNRLKIRFLQQLTKGNTIKLSGKSSLWFSWITMIHLSRGRIRARIFSAASWEFLKDHITRALEHKEWFIVIASRFDWHLHTKCTFLISYYQACDVVLLNQLDFSGLYYESPFHVSLGV